MVEKCHNNNYPNYMSTYNYSNVNITARVQCDDCCTKNMVIINISKVKQREILVEMSVPCSTHPSRKLPRGLDGS